MLLNAIIVYDFSLFIHQLRIEIVGKCVQSSVGKMFSLKKAHDMVYCFCKLLALWQKIGLHRKKFDGGKFWLPVRWSRGYCYYSTISCNDFMRWWVAYITIIISGSKINWARFSFFSKMRAQVYRVPLNNLKFNGFELIFSPAPAFPVEKFQTATKSCTIFLPRAKFYLLLSCAYLLNTYYNLVFAFVFTFGPTCKEKRNHG